MEERKVFLSFLGTLRLMRDGQVSNDDLASGLFYFGFARVLVMEVDPEELEEVSRIFRKEPGRGQKTLIRLRQALVIAETEGRAAWRIKGGAPEVSQKKLSDLLVANDAQPLNPNLPPVYESSFIATAIDRVNNKDGQVRLEVVY